MLGGKAGEFREAPAERRGNPEPSPRSFASQNEAAGEGAETKRPPSLQVLG